MRIPVRTFRSLAIDFIPTSQAIYSWYPSSYSANTTVGSSGSLGSIRLTVSPSHRPTVSPQRFKLFGSERAQRCLCDETNRVCAWRQDDLKYISHQTSDIRRPTSDFRLQTSYGLHTWRSKHWPNVATSLGNNTLFRPTDPNKKTNIPKITK